MVATEQCVSVRGRLARVSGLRLGDRTVVVTGKWLRIAAVKDEPLVEGEIVRDPVAFIAELRKGRVPMDIFTFAQKLPETKPKYDYKCEWDNWAAVPITSFNDWWERRLPQESRKNVRRAGKRGVVVKTVPFNDELVRGIHCIYNETPVRQGRRFWHFGKDFETVKRENSTYLDQSEFVGAYLGQELIGFIKIVFVGRNATIMQIISKNEHQDKRPMNAMLARAVELCANRGMSFLLYGKYVYNKKENSPMTEFKRRNGFEEIKYPRYFLPLTIKGCLAINCGLHLGVKSLIPAPLTDLLLSWRSRLYSGLYGLKETRGDLSQRAVENA